jgi:Lar family restriction alleviation protein
MSDDLKPCPFCGTNPLIQVYDDLNRQISYVIECNNYDCHAMPEVGSDRKEQAIAAWNIRALPAVTVANDHIPDVGKMVDPADRIEELESEVKQWHSEAMAWIKKWGAAEAKLAKAVEALRNLMEDAGDLGDNICYCQDAMDRDLHITAYGICEDARAVLAELEGK